ncbi:hypothetical protein HDU97_001881 [Phlyctochytrium planicorne]|nr:hypothetical protein HDU97_001881 [Phlyctochytrium planicorne]
MLYKDLSCLAFDPSRRFPKTAALTKYARYVELMQLNFDDGEFFINLLSAFSTPVVRRLSNLKQLHVTKQPESKHDGLDHTFRQFLGVFLGSLPNPDRLEFLIVNCWLDLRPFHIFTNVQMLFAELHALAQKPEAWPKVKTIKVNGFPTMLKSHVDALNRYPALECLEVEINYKKKNKKDRYPLFAPNIKRFYLNDAPTELMKFFDDMAVNGDVKVVHYDSWEDDYNPFLDQERIPMSKGRFNMLNIVHEHEFPIIRDF